MSGGKKNRGKPDLINKMNFIGMKKYIYSICI